MNKVTINRWKIGLLLATLLLSASAFCQDIKWDVPLKEAKKISIIRFDDDFVAEGRHIYDSSCMSCHGAPGKQDYVLMVPSPGDPVSDRFFKQPDGALFYKIKHGRDQMPGFKEAFADDEIWSLVAYFRSFDERYVQPYPDLKGKKIPRYKIGLSYDENVDKLVVKVTSQTNLAKGVDVTAYIKTMFGKYYLGSQPTSKLGLAYFDVDSKLPGDRDGNLKVIVKATKGYGFAKTSGSLKMGTPNIAKGATDGNHLWSTSEKAPLWIKLFFYGAFGSIWITIIYVIISIRKIRLYS